jgi:hypothetical protein
VWTDAHLPVGPRLLRQHLEPPDELLVRLPVRVARPAHLHILEQSEVSDWRRVGGGAVDGGAWARGSRTLTRHEIVVEVVRALVGVRADAADVVRRAGHKRRHEGRHLVLEGQSVELGLIIVIRSLGLEGGVP